MAPTRSNPPNAVLKAVACYNYKGSPLNAASLISCTSG
jgi:hypothetical protein